jgi:hypothetical protein
VLLLLVVLLLLRLLSVRRRRKRSRRSAHGATSRRRSLIHCSSLDCVCTGTVDCRICDVSGALGSSERRVIVNLSTLRRGSSVGYNIT